LRRADSGWTKGASLLRKSREEAAANGARESMTPCERRKTVETEVDLHTCSPQQGLSRSDSGFCGRGTTTVRRHSLVSAETIPLAHSSRSHPRGGVNPRRSPSRSLTDDSVLAKTNRPVNSKSGGSPSPAPRARSALFSHPYDRRSRLGVPGCREKAGPNDIRGLVSLRRRT